MSVWRMGLGWPDNGVAWPPLPRPRSPRQSRNSSFKSEGCPERRSLTGPSERCRGSGTGVCCPTRAQPRQGAGSKPKPVPPICLSQMQVLDHIQVEAQVSEGGPPKDRTERKRTTSKRITNEVSKGRLLKKDSVLVIEADDDVGGGAPPTPPPSPQAEVGFFGFSGKRRRKKRVASGKDATYMMVEQASQKLAEIVELRHCVEALCLAGSDGRLSKRKSFVASSHSSSGESLPASPVGSEVEDEWGDGDIVPTPRESDEDACANTSLHRKLSIHDEECDEKSALVVMAAPALKADDGGEGADDQGDSPHEGSDLPPSLSESVVESSETTRPEVGDTVVLGQRAPNEYRGSCAVVTQVAANHCTVIVLDQTHRFGVGECWPCFDDVLIQNCKGRLGMRVMIDGLTGAKTRKLNGFRGTVCVHPREGHPTFIRKAASPDPQLTLCVALDEAVSGEKLVVLEPRFLVLYDTYMAQIAALGDALSSLAALPFGTDSEAPGSAPQ
uniref:Uncharacterized protein n=1 Tax=Noctiluca scintillans TaxID=2966 RepID=A0A7S1ABS0_NOCSC|mmetsp:Transcript_39871/g.105754  ORF Transcript_39871/g.105754 Transcript_39871/m.105754 type:complete len:500 (+) Transcript_39871:80-1579(+)